LKHNYKASFRINKNLWDLSDYYFKGSRSEAIRNFIITTCTNNNEQDLINSIEYHKLQLKAFEVQYEELQRKKILNETMPNDLQLAFDQLKAIYKAHEVIGRNVIKMKSLEHEVKYEKLLELCELNKMIFIDFQDIY